jgi:predicted metal-binding membrane protein
MTAMMVLRSATLAGAFLIAAGLYQLTPFKKTCLAHCRSPAQFHRRALAPRSVGARRMGLAHGGYCVAAARR